MLPTIQIINNFLTYTSMFSRFGNLTLFFPLFTLSLKMPTPHCTLLILLQVPRLCLSAPSFPYFCFSHPERSLHLRGGSTLQQTVVHACFQLSLPTLRAGPKFCAKQTSLCFSSKSTRTEADNSEAEWMHSMYTSVSRTALAINQC